MNDMISASDLANSITSAQQHLDASSGGLFLKLHKGGFWVYGTDDTETEEESRWAINPGSFAIGFIAWPAGDSVGAPLGEVMRGIAQGPIPRSELPDADGGEWVQQVGCQLMCVSGEDVGTSVIFKTSSKGGIGGYNDLLNQVLAHLKANAGTEEVVPVVELEVKSYKHAKFGKIYTPVFKIGGWSTMDAMPTEPDEEEEEEEEEVVVPKKKAAKKKAAKKELPPPEPEVEDEEVEEEVAEEAAPRKRRRRRSA